MNLFLRTIFLTLLFDLTFVTAWKSSAFPSQPVLVPQRTSYIVHTLNTSRPAHFLTQNEWYSSLIRSLPHSNKPDATVPKPRIFYVYETAIQGFAATLTPEEAQMISENDGVIGVYEDVMFNIHTTHSPEFIGLNPDYGIWKESNLGDDVIIGLLDTGIWPESQSFNDSGLNPVGPRWQGECEVGIRFNSSMCNNKLVGARFFRAGAEAIFGSQVSDNDYLSPRDHLGHGTHTSSTATGSPILGANFYGQETGTAQGMAPNAKIAMYKVCWGAIGCASSDILAAVDKAIEDGVDILSLSLGSIQMIPYYNDAIAIGVFAAERHRIFVVCSAGNSGPHLTTVVNTAPWITTVAAGSIDRTLQANLTLGSGEVLFGESLYFGVISGIEMLPIISISFCYSDVLIASEIMGKIVVCRDATVSTGFLIQAAGGAGLVSINVDPSLGETIVAKRYTLPSLSLGYDESRKLIAYMNSTMEPMARLEYDGHTVIGKNRAPQVAFYSSRGPNYEMPELLKPDILAPGNNILAAWPSETPVSGDPSDPRRSDFNIMSGTSMACPHVAGTAALLRHLKPTWSPAMIRSAMMTTALVLDNRDRPIVAADNSQDATPLAFGGGHVYPQAALDPGLVYDAGFEDYAQWLCKLNYTSEQMRRFVSLPINCSHVHYDHSWDLNYPSFVVVFKNQTGHRVVRRRTLMKVSDFPENYTARVVNLSAEKVSVKVRPEMLDFVGTYEKRDYTVEFKSKIGANTTVEYGFAYVIWENKEHQVKSPVVFIWDAVSVFK
ncbi:subtilisin-like protease [Carex littledalei]|uniref:Subtilisin-like protease n=1 Tax=Carex littledalei TaxID=544730 RepID=A0A833QP73_9POAL|nr:subtilisin-like protease [Carex littledalei]